MNNKDNERIEELRKQYGDNVELRTSEVRAAGDDSLVIEGYAANFDTETDLGYFRETIARGAFDDVLEDDVRLLLNHEGAPMARTTNGTLELSVDENGLKYRAALADTQDGRDLYKLIKRGDISQSSFAFTITDEKWSEDRSTRTVQRMGKLLDVSPVTYPAYATTTVSARNMAAAKEEAEEMKTEQEAPEVRQELETIKTEVRNLAPNNFKKMTLNDLKGTRSAHYEEFVAVGQKADSEGRTLTEAEQERCDKLDGLIIDLDSKIKHKEREQQMVARMAQSGSAGTSEKREVERVNGSFSLSRAIAAISNGKQLEGAEAEWSTEARREMRAQGLQSDGQVSIPSIALRTADDFQATTGEAGAGFVPTVVPSAIQALRAPTVIEGLGTTMIRNATGNLQFPRVSAKAVGTAPSDPSNEVGADAASQLNMDQVVLTPQRVAAFTTYSKMLILQGGSEVDTLISNELAAAMNAYIDDYAFDTIMASTAVNQTLVADGALTTAIVNSLETDALAQGANLAGANYVMSPGAYGLTKVLAQVGNVTPLWENGRFNMYNATATPYLVNGFLEDGTTASKGQMVFGNFAQGAICALFGGVDLLVDPYSAAANGQIKLHVNRFFDFDLRQPGALSIAKHLNA